MSEETKTPLEEAAHAIWPLEWEEKHGDLMAYMPLFGWLGFIESDWDFCWEFDGGDVLNNLPLPNGLETDVERLTVETITPILTAARDVAAKHLREALALCELPTCNWCDEHHPPMAVHPYTHRDGETVEDILVCARCSKASTAAPDTVQALKAIAARLSAGEDITAGQRLGPPPLPEVARRALDQPPGHVDPLPHRAATPEPSPMASEGDVWAEIIGRLEPGPLREACVARCQMGIDKYGQPLQRGDGRDHRVDEAQEHLDAAAYRAAWAGANDPEVMAALRRAGECLGVVEPYPVRVVHHAGEAVLMLTATGGTARPVRRAYIREVAQRSRHTSIVVLSDSIEVEFGYQVKEPAVDILRTLEMLREEQGGEG